MGVEMGVSCSVGGPGNNTASSLERMVGCKLTRVETQSVTCVDLCVLMFSGASG